MKTPIETYFDKIFVITLKRRTDRLEHALGVLSDLGIEEGSIDIHYGPDRPLDHEGKPNGNLGCTTAHRQVLDLIIEKSIPRTLVLEDDFDIAFTNPGQASLWMRNPNLGLRVDPQSVFAATVPQIPDDWDMLYLGRHFAEMPQKRVSPNLIRINRMLTTSSYGITCLMAKKMAPAIVGIGPIDNLYGGFHRENKCYCVDPTMFIQMPCHSDLREKFENYVGAMQSMDHIRALDAGKIYPPPS
jgi:hypothetical protein